LPDLKRALEELLDIDRDAANLLIREIDIAQTGIARASITATADRSETYLASLHKAKDRDFTAARRRFRVIDRKEKSWRRAGRLTPRSP